MLSLLFDLGQYLCSLLTSLLLGDWCLSKRPLGPGAEGNCRGVAEWPVVIGVAEGVVEFRERQSASSWLASPLCFRLIDPTLDSACG